MVFYYTRMILESGKPMLYISANKDMLEKHIKMMKQLGAEIRHGYAKIHVHQAGVLELNDINVNYEA